MALGNVTSVLYRNIFKRSSTFALLILGGAIYADKGTDVLATYVFDTINEGRQWKDIKKNL